MNLFLEKNFRMVLMELQNNKLTNSIRGLAFQQLLFCVLNQLLNNIGSY
jgi:hypothetical protein